MAPVAVFGLAMAWLVGWRQGRQLYQRFYNEELSAGEVIVLCAWCGKEMRRECGLGQSVISEELVPPIEPVEPTGYSDISIPIGEFQNQPHIDVVMSTVLGAELTSNFGF